MGIVMEADAPEPNYCIQCLRIDTLTEVADPDDLCPECEKDMARFMNGLGGSNAK
jgi:hypothetical protein